MGGEKRIEKKLWEKGYTLNERIEDFTVGEDYILDQRLIKYDCLASIAHAKMLGKVGLLKDEEAKKLIHELNLIIDLDKEKFWISRQQEDCHTAIENHLTERLGDLGEKIHTARSRNDQVLTALRLYYRDELNACRGLVDELVKSIEGFVVRYGGIKLPGYTHMRKAMPSSIALWANSFVESMEDNQKLIDMAEDLVDRSPLGTGAGYGVPIEIDREYSAELLGFRGLQNNPIYVQNSRGKFEATILHALSQVMFDLNKIASDLILFSMPEFGYFQLPRELCTGSSIMPQKRNPDVLELVRAKYHEVISLEFEIKAMMGDLPSGYNRDLQLTKGPVMRGFDAVKETLAIMELLFENLIVNEANCAKAMTAELYATEEIYELVRRGVPFREAYRRVVKRYS